MRTQQGQAEQLCLIPVTAKDTTRGDQHFAASALQGSFAPDTSLGWGTAPGTDLHRVRWGFTPCWARMQCPSAWQSFLPTSSSDVFQV